MKQDFTVKEIAEKLKVSKPTIQRCIKELSIKPTRIVSNKFRYYALDDVKTLINHISCEEIDFAELFGTPQNTPQNTAKSTETPQSSPQSTETPTDTPPQTANINKKDGENEAINVMLAMLQEEIKKKDLELAKKDERIEKLESRLQEAHLEILNFGKNAQYITAVDKTNQYLTNKEVNDVVDNEAIEPKKSKKSWFFKLFK